MRDQNGLPLPLEIGTIKRASEEAPQLYRHGSWVCLNIHPTIAWPVRPQRLVFAGYETWIVPLTIECCPGVAINCSQGINEEEAELLLYRLVSVISWREQTGISIIVRTGGNLPHMMGRDNNSMISIRRGFDFTEIICPEEEGPRVALALMREARSLYHHAYSFLSFWKVLEWSFPNTKERSEWMQRQLLTLDGHGVSEARASIPVTDPAAMAKHLFESGRGAVAHARVHPIINPDRPRDAARLFLELPIVRELAIRAIEEVFKIDTPATEYRKHLYELRGWKEALGAELVAKISESGDSVKDGTICLPVISIRLLDCAPYSSFESMLPDGAFIVEGGLKLQYRTKSELGAVCFYLDFVNERLIFDIENGIYCADDGSVAAAEQNVDVCRFFRDYFLNGSLQVWDSESGLLLSRRDSFVPINCMVDLPACNQNIAAAKDELEKRRAVFSSGC